MGNRRKERNINFQDEFGDEDRDIIQNRRYLGRGNCTQESVNRASHGLRNSPRRTKW
jgi:hypothetical protein